MIIPKGHKILIRKDPIKKKVGMIELAVDERMEKTGVQTGTLVAAGDQAWLAFRQVDDKGNECNGRPWAKPGDYVLFARYSGADVEDPFDPDEQNFTVFNDEDIIAVIEEGKYTIKENPHRAKVIQEENS